MRLVYAGTDDALYTWQPGSRGAGRITWGWEEMEEGGGRSRLSYNWPTCSPDGRRILTFARRGSKHHFVHVVDTTGVETEELTALGETVPIYGNWSPDGSRVAILVQQRDTLSLETFASHSQGRPSVVVRGAPLFWSWAPDGKTLAIHAGQSTQDISAGGTFLADAVSGEIRQVLSAVPAMFRAPSWSADGRFLAFARVGEGGARLVLMDPLSGERRSRELDRGPIAFVWHPSLPVIAYAIATDQAPHVYERVVLLDLREDRERTISLPTLAFFWHPEQVVLFRLAIDQGREQLSWEANTDDGPRQVLARFLPTRETIFMASFFDQYALSHPPVAPDGTLIAFSGRLIGDEDGNGPRVYVVPTDGGETSVVVGDGLCPAWGT